MSPLLAVLAQPVDQDPVPIDGVDVAWSALAPVLALIGGALLLLVADSLSSRKPLRSVYALFTTVIAARRIAFSVPLWDRVQDPDEGPFSTLGQAVGVDGFSVFATVTIAAGGDPRRAPPRRLAAARGHGGSGAVRAHAPVGIRWRDDGVGQRPDRDVPRPRDPLDRRVRAGRDAPAEDHLAGSRREVLRARRLQLRLLPLRHRPHLRRHGLHEPRRHRRLPRHHRPRRLRPRAGRPRLCSSWASRSRWRRCRSTSGRPTCTRERPARAWRGWHRA